MSTATAPPTYVCLGVTAVWDNVPIVGGVPIDLGEREVVAWLLRESRMPSRGPLAQVNRLKAGDDLFVVTTQVCWHNPIRDGT
ncbi:hypothetical protein GCM10010149_33460 [Nonomuraea roseoviolacea subsp. roseoviolacea]